MDTLTPSQQQEINELHSDIRHYVEAADSEAYADSITKDMPTFKRLIQCEAKTEREFGKYFDTLGRRIATVINWTAYNRLVKASDTEAMIKVALTLIEGDKTLLVSLGFNMFEEASTIGVDAAVANYNIPVKYEALQTKIKRQAIRYSNDLVKQVNSTTRDILRTNLRTSIELGENINDATDRIMNTLNDPKGTRAYRIARTEPVNSYGRGTLLFGQETGAKGKVADVVLDDRTSLICKEIHAKYGGQKQAIPLSRPYTWQVAGGGSKDTPGFHVLCRTGHHLIY